MGKRKAIDWEAVETEYRLGQKSLRVIASIFGITAGAISKKAKKQNWYQDKTKEVQQKTKAALLKETSDGNTDGNTPSREDVDKAVQTNIEVIRGHRKNIVKGREIVALLSAQLLEAAGIRENLEDEIIDDTKAPEGGKPNLKRRNRLMKAVALPSHSGVLRDLSMALKNLIPLERQAFNIDEDGLVSVDEVLAAAERVSPALGKAMREMLKNA